MSAENTANTPAPTPNGAKPWHRRKRFLIFVGVLVLGAIGFGAYYFFYSRYFEDTDDAFIEAHVIQISPKVSGQVIRVAVQDNQAVKAGDVLVEIDGRDYEVKLAQEQASLQAAQAKLAGADVNIGLTDTSSKADVDIAGQGVSVAGSSVDAAKAQAATAQSKYEQAQIAVKTAQAVLEQYKAEVVAAQAEATRTADDLKRYSQLIQSGSVTRQQYDAAAAASASAGAKLDSASRRVAVAGAQIAEAQASEQVAADGVKQAQAQLDQARPGVPQAQAKLAQVNVTSQKVAVSQSQRDSAQADVELFKANVAQAQLQLSYTKIVAPSDGRVTRKSIEAGNYVVPGQPLMAIVTPDRWVVANFKETQLTHIQSGASVKVKIDTYPGVSFQGHVDSIQAGTGSRFSLLPPENATGNYVKIVQRLPIKIVFDGPLDSRYPLQPGMSVIPQVKVR